MKGGTVAEKRSYSSPLREADAAATRRRVIDAASRLFIRDGYGATTLKAIGDEAGVSAQTVYLNGPKPALLMAAYELAIGATEGFSSLNDTEAMQRIVTEPDVSRMLDLYTDYMAAALGPISDLVVTLRAAADTDAAVRTLYRQIEERRAFSLHQGIGLMVARGVVPPDQAENAEVMLSLLTTSDNYLLLRKSGWSVERYRDWLRSELDKLAAGATG